MENSNNAPFDTKTIIKLSQIRPKNRTTLTGSGTLKTKKVSKSASLYPAKGTAKRRPLRFVFVERRKMLKIGF